MSLISSFSSSNISHSKNLKKMLWHLKAAISNTMNWGKGFHWFLADILPLLSSLHVLSKFHSAWNRGQFSIINSDSSLFVHCLIPSLGKLCPHGHTSGLFSASTPCTWNRAWFTRLKDYLLSGYYLLATICWVATVKLTQELHGK